MKKLTIIILLCSFTVFGQFFDSTIEESNSTTNSNIFAESAQPGITPPEDPDIGVDQGNPGPPLPVDDYWYFLVIGGLCVGVYFLYSKKIKFI